MELIGAKDNIVVIRLKRGEFWDISQSAEVFEGPPKDGYRTYHLTDSVILAVHKFGSSHEHLMKAIEEVRTEAGEPETWVSAADMAEAVGCLLVKKPAEKPAE